MLVVAACSVPFYIASDKLNLLGYSLQMIGALSSLLTFFIAIVLFNKFGIEKSIIERNTEVVLTLLEKLRKQVFLMDVVVKQRVAINFSPMSGLKEVAGDLAAYKDFPLIFGKSYIKQLEEVQQLVDNLFMPREIAQKFEILRFNYGTFPKDEMSDNYIIVKARPTADELNESIYAEIDKVHKLNLDSKVLEARVDALVRSLHHESPCLFNNRATSLEDFARNWNHLVEAIKVWLKKNSNLRLSLNID